MLFWDLTCFKPKSCSFLWAQVSCLVQCLPRICLPYLQQGAAHLCNLQGLWSTLHRGCRNGFCSLQWDHQLQLPIDFYWLWKRMIWLEQGTVRDLLMYHVVISYFLLELYALLLNKLFTECPQWLNGTSLQTSISSTSLMVVEAELDSVRDITGSFFQLKVN